MAKQFSNKRISVNIIVVLAGLITPFIPYWVVIQMFYLLIPMALAFVVLSIYLILAIFNKQANLRSALYSFAIIPLFVVTQIGASFLVYNVQLWQANNVIEGLENSRKMNGSLPETIDSPLGISYQRLQQEDGYMLSFSRGFMVTEKYNSETKKWTSYGWND